MVGIFELSGIMHWIGFVYCILYLLCVDFIV